MMACIRISASDFDKMGYLGYSTKVEEGSLCYILDVWLKCKRGIEYYSQILNCMSLRNCAAIKPLMEESVKSDVNLARPTSKISVLCAFKLSRSVCHAPSTTPFIDPRSWAASGN